VAFLKRCAEALRENGIIVIKDNLNSKEGFYVDKEDNSITR
jgi:spermidine synthase